MEIRPVRATESGRHFVATHPLMSDHYCRVRVPDSATHLNHLAYRMKRAAL